MPTTRRTYAGMQALRNQLVTSPAAIHPAALAQGDSFYVIGFTSGDGPEDGVTVRTSGVFHEHVENGKYVIVQLDGEPEPQQLSTQQVGFFPPGSAMLVTVKSLFDVHQIFGEDFINADLRSDVAQAAEIARRPCPCGIVHGDGRRCADWPDCVIP
jgi:hypothetical protein